MLRELKKLVDKSIDAYLYEDEAVLKDCHHPLSRYQVWKAYDQARNQALITQAEYEELHAYYDQMLYEYRKGSIEEVMDKLKQSPMFEVWNGENYYTCTPSLKTSGVQISIFKKIADEWIAIGDQQCLTWNHLKEAIKDYHLVYLLNRYFYQLEH